MSSYYDCAKHFLKLGFYKLHNRKGQEYSVQRPDLFMRTGLVSDGRQLQDDSGVFHNGNPTNL